MNDGSTNSAVHVLDFTQQKVILIGKWTCSKCWCKHVLGNNHDNKKCRCAVRVVGQNVLCCYLSWSFFRCCSCCCSSGSCCYCRCLVVVVIVVFAVVAAVVVVVIVVIAIAVIATVFKYAIKNLAEMRVCNVSVICCTLAWTGYFPLFTMSNTLWAYNPLTHIYYVQLTTGEDEYVSYRPTHVNACVQRGKT